MKPSKIFQTGSSLPHTMHAVDLKSPIGIKWTSLGGEPVTGRALGEPFALDDGIGLMQLFVVGAIVWSPGFGAVHMSERVWRKWSSPSVEARKTPAGTTVQAFLGCPIADTERHASAAAVREWLYFERGMLYVGPEGSWAVSGEVYGHYRVLAGVGGLLGPPVSDEQKAPGGGRVSHFERGDIFFHARTGAREVHGAIRERYLELDGPAGVLGYPSSDEESIRGARGEIGRFNRFEGGSGIYFSGATGAWEVYGAIWALWQAGGGVAGRLGFPTSGETDTPTSSGRFNEFQHGVTVWHGAGPYEKAYEVTDLQLVIARFTVNEDFNVQVHITATPDQVNHGRIPADDEFDGGVKDFDPPLIMVGIDTVRANSAIGVWMEAISENTVGKDDRMGTITARYTIDNLWGLLDASFNLHDDAFDATVRVEPKTLQNPTDATAMFWPFDNTDTFKLGWESYARTFRDVKETDKHLNFNPLHPSFHPWEIFLYEAFYNSLAQAGFCFGACLEAVYARERRSLFLQPLQDNPFNPYQRNHPRGQPAKPLDPARAGDGTALDEVNVKHGYQIGAGMIEFFLGKWTAGALHDPERAYRESYADFQAGNWPLLTISDQDAFSQDHGHAVLPYEWVPTPDQIDRSFPDQPLVIYVKNPNFPQAARDDRHCRIEINRLTWKWKFQFDDKELWTGSGSQGGRLLAIPYSELNARPVTPGYAVFELLSAGILLVVGGEGGTEQITDGHGRTFFRNATALAHPSTFSHAVRSAHEINWDAESRIPNLMQVPMFGSAAGTASAAIGAHQDLRRSAGAAEFYYHRPGPPPKPPAGRARDRVTETFVGLGIGSQGRAASVGAAPAAAAADALHFELRGKGHGKMSWTVASPRMSATVVADMEPGVVDSIQLAGAGGHFQSVAVRFPNATKPRVVSIAVSGWRGEGRLQAKSFVLEGLSMEGADTVRAQLSDGGHELTLENHGAGKTFDLRLVAGPGAETVALRSGVSIDAASVVRLRPSDWSRSAPATAPIRLDVLDAGGLKVLRTSNL